MTREKFERDYNIDLNTVNWKTIQTNFPGITYDAAIVGPYCIYNENGNYYLTYESSVCRWIHDLSKWSK